MHILLLDLVELALTNNQERDKLVSVSRLCFVLLFESCCILCTTHEFCNVLLPSTVIDCRVNLTCSI